MDSHGGVPDLLGAWALGACDDDESARVEAHLTGCATCAAEANRLRVTAGWLALDGAVPPPVTLRDGVLAVARTRRAPNPLGALAAAYAAQVARLDGVLRALSAADWHRPDPRHATVDGIIAHLAANDARLAEDAGVPARPGTGGTARATWRAQADALVAGLVILAPDRPVRLAGRGAPQRAPVRDALVQRAFETWIHLDDVTVAVGRPLPPPPTGHIRHIADLAARLLPRAMVTTGTVHLVLHGPGGGEWTVDAGAGPEATIFADAVAFCRLVANRIAPDALRHTVHGDRPLAAATLRAAATLGCD